MKKYTDALPIKKNYTKHLLKFRKNQADNLVAVENRFILDFGADFFLYFILIFKLKVYKKSSKSSHIWLLRRFLSTL